QDACSTPENKQNACSTPEEQAGCVFYPAKQAGRVFYPGKQARCVFYPAKQARCVFYPGEQAGCVFYPGEQAGCVFYNTQSIRTVSAESAILPFPIRNSSIPQSAILPFHNPQSIRCRAAIRNPKFFYGVTVKVIGIVTAGSLGSLLLKSRFA
ncbi:MAG: hypothetical protein ACPGWR_18425, partial [Ardenticatenaceae bacterium]